MVPFYVMRFYYCVGPTGEPAPNPYTNASGTIRAMGPRLKSVASRA